ncbi:unnamed protein product, partial [Pleuronectes platessa]
SLNSLSLPVFSLEDMYSSPQSGCEGCSLHISTTRWCRRHCSLKHQLGIGVLVSPLLHGDELHKMKVRNQNPLFEECWYYWFSSYRDQGMKEPTE